MRDIRRCSVFTKIAEGTNFLYPRLVSVIKRQTLLLVVVSCCWLFLLFLLFLLFSLYLVIIVVFTSSSSVRLSRLSSKKVLLSRLSSKRSSSVLFDFCQVDAVVLFYLSHDEGALDGTDGLDVAEFREYELLVLFHIACANL